MLSERIKIEFGKDQILNLDLAFQNFDCVEETPINSNKKSVIIKKDIICKKLIVLGLLMLFPSLIVVGFMLFKDLSLNSQFIHLFNHSNYFKDFAMIPAYICSLDNIYNAQKFNKTTELDAEQIYKNFLSKFDSSRFILKLPIFNKAFDSSDSEFQQLFLHDWCEFQDDLKEFCQEDIIRQYFKNGWKFQISSFKNFFDNCYKIFLKNNTVNSIHASYFDQLNIDTIK